MASSADSERADRPQRGLALPTLGGKQLWTDHVWRAGWRVQCHAITGHWRLINSRNRRLAWGSREFCEVELERLVPRTPLDNPEIVIVSHGLFRSSGSMRHLARTIKARLPVDVILFEYASTRFSVADHAAALRNVVAGLPTEARLSFVGHSLGNIVTRRAIGDWQRDHHVGTLERLKSIVMLGPPNQGASLARQLARLALFPLVAGPSGLEIGPGWQTFSDTLAIPPCPFGIIAGNLPSRVPRNPLMAGTGDFIVSVEETRLPGCSDFLEVPQVHALMMDDPKVQEAVICFLDHQNFASN